jgi:hypothetical protein
MHVLGLLCDLHFDHALKGCLLPARLASTGFFPHAVALQQRHMILIALSSTLALFRKAFQLLSFDRNRRL